MDRTARTPLIAAMTRVGLASRSEQNGPHTDEYIFVSNVLHNITGKAVRLANAEQHVDLPPSCNGSDDGTQQRPERIPTTRYIGKKNRLVVPILTSP